MDESHAQNLPVLGNRNEGVVAPRTWEDAVKRAAYLADSTLIPKAFQKKPADILVAWQLGAELGLSPMQALQSICVFNGRPSLWGDAGLAIAFASGLLEDFEETDDEERKIATCRARRKGSKHDVVRTFAQTDADRIRMYEGREGGGGEWKPLAERFAWKNFPKRMRQMRARWWCLRDVLPDVMKGILGAEENESGQVGTGDVESPAPAEAAGQEMMPRERSAPPPPPPPVNESVNREAPEAPDHAAGEAPAAPVAGIDRLAFEINGQKMLTAGVTREQMFRLFALCAKVNKAKGKGYDKVLLEKEFGVDTRVDLTAEAAEQYEIRLGEILETP